MVDELCGDVGDWACETGAEECVDDEPWGRLSGVEVCLCGDDFDVHFGDDIEVDFGIVWGVGGDGFWWGDSDDLGLIAEDLEVSCGGEAVSGVVSWSCGDDDVLVSGGFEHLGSVFGDCGGGVLHEDDGGYGEGGGGEVV